MEMVQKQAKCNIIVLIITLFVSVGLLSGCQNSERTINGINRETVNSEKVTNNESRENEADDVSIGSNTYNEVESSEQSGELVTAVETDEETETSGEYVTGTDSYEADEQITNQNTVTEISGNPTTNKLINQAEDVVQKQAEATTHKATGQTKEQTATNQKTTKQSAVTQTTMKQSAITQTTTRQSAVTQTTGKQATNQTTTKQSEVTQTTTKKSIVQSVEEQTTTSKTIEPAKETYTVNIKIYKEVNNVKTYVKTTTIKGEYGDFYKIPIALEEDKRCKIAEYCMEITGVDIVSKETFEICVNIYPQYMYATPEGDYVKAKIEGNANYEVTYYCKDLKINIVKMDEDGSETTIKKYTITGGLGDIFSVELSYNWGVQYLLEEAIAKYAATDGTYYMLSFYSYDVKKKQGDSWLSYWESVPGKYQFEAELFKKDIDEIEIKYFGYNYSYPVYESIIKDGMTDYQKAKAIHDWIVSKCYYDYTGEFGLESYFAIGVFKNHRAVCSGYARAFMQLANWAGLECEKYTCSAMNHAWNRVKIDGQWYNVDCTFSGKEGLFFLKSDAYLKRTGQYSGFVSDGKCSSTKYD